MEIERTMQFILECQASTEARLQELAETSAANAARHDRQIAQINNILRRAIRASVEEHRRERVRRQEMDKRFDEKITQLASAQLLNEGETQKLKAEIRMFMDWWRHNGNGSQTS
jgi:hypothetical protein